MSRQRYATVALVVGLVFAAAILHHSAADEKGLPAPHAVNAAARRDAAISVLEGMRIRRAQEPELVPADYWYVWSVRRLQAERDLGRTKADQIAALEAHLKRMQDAKETSANEVRKGMAPAYAVPTAEFFCLEAENWLADARAADK